MISIWHKTGNLSVVLLDTQLLADVRSNFFFLMPVCSEFCKIQKYNFSVLILIPTLHSRSYGLIIYIAHMSPTLVSKKISELFKKPKKWSAPQRPRTDLNKRSLPRPKTTTAWKLIPHRPNISKNWNPPRR